MFSPLQLDHAAPRWVLAHRHSELVHRSVHGLFFQINARQVLAFIILGPPLTDLFVDDQLGRAVLVGQCVRL